jgi:hypothetical protein
MVMGALAFARVQLVEAGPSPKPHTGSAPVLDEDVARRAGLSPSEVNDANRLYTAKCMRCHKSYEPAAYSQPEWNSWMIKMRKKAHLGPGQDQLLSRYLDAYRSGRLLSKTNAIAGELTGGDTSGILGSGT